MAYDVSTITVSGASLLASATAADKLILVGCDATTEVLTQEQAVAVTTRPANPFSNTTRISLEGSDGEHVYIRVLFVAGASTGGDANTLYLYGHPESDSTTNTVLAVLSSADGFHLPVVGDVANTYSTLFDVIYTPESGAIETINTSAYATYAEFKRLKDRTVTRYREGNTALGDNQTILGIKSFKEPINFPFNSNVNYDMITLSNGKLSGKFGATTTQAMYSAVAKYDLILQHGKVWTTGQYDADRHAIGFVTDEDLQNDGSSGIESHSKLFTSYCTAAGVISKENALIDFGYKQYSGEFGSIGRRGFVNLSAVAYTDASSTATSTASLKLDNTASGSEAWLTAREFHCVVPNKIYLGGLTDLDITYTGAPEGSQLKHSYISSNDLEFKTTLSDAGYSTGHVIDLIHGSANDAEFYSNTLVDCDGYHADLEIEAKSNDSNLYMRSYSGSTKTLNCGVVNVNKSAVNIASTAANASNMSVLNVQPVSTDGTYGIRAEVGLTSGHYASIKFKYVGQSSSTDVFVLDPEVSTSTVIDLGTSSHKLRNIYANNLYGTAMNAFSNVQQDNTTGKLKFTDGDGTTSTSVGIDTIASQVLRGQFDSLGQVGQLRLCIFQLGVTLSSALTISAGDEYFYDVGGADPTTTAAYGTLYVARISGSGTSIGNISYDGSVIGRWVFLNGAYFTSSAQIGDWAVILAVKTSHV